MSTYTSAGSIPRLRIACLNGSYAWTSASAMPYSLRYTAGCAPARGVHDTSWLVRMSTTASYSLFAAWSKTSANARRGNCAPGDHAAAVLAGSASFTIGKNVPGARFRACSITLKVVWISSADSGSSGSAGAADAPRVAVRRPRPDGGAAPTSPAEMSTASTVSAAATTVAVRFGMRPPRFDPRGVDPALADHLPPPGRFCQPVAALSGETGPGDQAG